jgi:hypothetical protein
MAPEMALLPFDHFLLVNDQRNEKTKNFFCTKDLNNRSDRKYYEIFFYQIIIFC